MTAVALSTPRDERSTPARADVIVEAIVDLPALDRLRTAWEEVHAADRYGHVFLSWAWLRAFLAAIPIEPVILAVRCRRDRSCVAFFPLARRPIKTLGVTTGYELVTAASPFADYTGLICKPEHEAAALEAIAQHLRKREWWDVLTLRDLLDARVERMLEAFDRERFPRTVDHVMACPHIELPRDWSTYLDTCVTRKTKETLRARMRQVAALPGFRTTVADAQTIERDIEILLRFRVARWGGDLADQLATVGALLRECFARGCLWLAVQWDGAEPLAAVAALTDPVHRTFSNYLITFNAERSRISPGRALMGHTIRHAIEHGYAIYDFLRGGEAYKSQYGTKDRFIKTIRVHRMNLRRSVADWLRGGAHLSGASRTTARRVVGMAVRRLPVVRSSRLLVCRSEAPPLAAAAAATAPGGAPEVGIFTPADLAGMRSHPALAELELSPEACERAWREGGFGILARLDGAPVGTVWCAFSPVYTSEIGRDVHPLSGTGYVYHLEVVPGVRGKGIAGVLIRAICEELRRRGITAVWWLVRRENAASRRAFAKVLRASETAITVIETPFGSRIIAPWASRRVARFLGLSLLRPARAAARRPPPTR